MTLHQAVWAHLVAEVEKPGNEKEAKEVAGLLERPNFDSAADNATRYRALMSFRRHLWSQLPPDVVWSKVDFIYSAESSEQLVTPWPKVIESKREVSMTPGLIAFSHGGKYYILEGNNRVSQWRYNGCPAATGVIYVATSEMPCTWVPSDHCKGYIQFHGGHYP